jgi:acylphosphatase
MIARRLVIRGRVQGVGYRYSMVEAAYDFGVVGWVRNTREGTVEAVVQGDGAAVEGIIGWCRQGPPHSRVTSVDVVDEPVGLHHGFEQRLGSES